MKFWAVLVGDRGQLPEEILCFNHFLLNFAHFCNLVISEISGVDLLEGVFVLFSLHESLYEPNGDIQVNPIGQCK